MINKVSLRDIIITYGKNSIGKKIYLNNKEPFNAKIINFFTSDFVQLANLTKGGYMIVNKHLNVYIDGKDSDEELNNIISLIYDPNGKWIRKS